MQEVADYFANSLEGSKEEALKSINFGIYKSTGSKLERCGEPSLLDIITDHFEEVDFIV
jgi:hypothetical protein